MYSNRIIQWILYFFIYCFIGWVWETSYVSIRTRKLTNRGFMTGPFLPIYGFGVLSILLATYPVRYQTVLIFFVGTLAATILEYITGVAMEAIFKVRYWDYSNQRFNVNGHICLSSSIGWGVSSIVIVKGIHVPIAQMVAGIPNQIQEIITIVLSVTMTADFAMSVRDALDIREMLMNLRKNNEEIKKLQRRMDVLVAVLDDEAQNLKAKIEQAIEQRTDDEAAYFGKKISAMKKRFEILELRAKDIQRPEIGPELELLKEKLGSMLAKVERPKSRAVKYTSRLLRRNPNAVSREFAEELNEMKDKKS